MNVFLSTFDRIRMFVYLRVQQSNTLAGVHQLLLSHFAASLCLFQSCPQLLNFSYHETVPTFHHGSLLLQVFCSSGGIIKMQLGILILTENTYQ